MDYSADNPQSRLQSTPLGHLVCLASILAPAGFPSKMARLYDRAGQLYAKPATNSIGSCGP